MQSDVNASLSALHKGPNAISVFFPCYNEQDNIGRVVKRATEVLKVIGADYEIIIVNDGSADRTGQVADELARADNRIKVVHHPQNRGYGAALQSGFRAATKAYVFFTDGDGQFDIEEMPAMLPLMERYDIVCGFRLDRKDPIMRKLNGRLWTKLVCFLFGMRIRDIDCAFKLFRRDVFDHIKMESSGALISAEILARATKAGYKITEMGVHHYPRTAGKQTGAKLRVILRAFRELFALYNRIRKGQ
ncbi:MAG: glycosyltransferase family 2 protein [Sedimentisphaerales bacterium]|nr:glycosyltransferase family 2 protein [Sedimentisphaerales bacterium]